MDRLGPLPRTKYAIVVQIASEEFARIVAALAETSDKGLYFLFLGFCVVQFGSDEFFFAF